jgi:hypothetical protein
LAISLAWNCIVAKFYFFIAVNVCFGSRRGKVKKMSQVWSEDDISSSSDDDVVEQKQYAQEPFSKHSVVQSRSNYDPRDEDTSLSDYSDKDAASANNSDDPLDGSNYKTAIRYTDAFHETIRRKDYKKKPDTFRVPSRDREIIKSQQRKSREYMRQFGKMKLKCPEENACKDAEDPTSIACITERLCTEIEMERRANSDSLHNTKPKYVDVSFFPRGVRRCDRWTPIEDDKSTGLEKRIIATTNQLRKKCGLNGSWTDPSLKSKKLKKNVGYNPSAANTGYIFI